jgi:hypothetical protein
MAIARVAASQFSEAAGVTTRILTRSPTTVGNLLVVGFSVGDFTGNLSIADTGGHTWNILHTVLHDSPGSVSSMSWWTLATTTGSIDVTCTSTASNFCIMSLEEFSGVDASPVDQVVRSAAGASGTPTSPSFTPTADDELVWCWCADSLTAVGNIDGSAATAGANGPTYTGGDGTQFRVLTGRSGVAMTAAMTGSGGYTLMAATFKPLAGSAPALGEGVLSFAGQVVSPVIFEPNLAHVIIRKS